MHAARSRLTLVATAVLTVLAVLFLVVPLAVAPLVLGDDGPPSVTDRDTLVIGVRDTPPGLAFRAGDGSLQGFDVDVSTYIAGRLGVTSGDLTFRVLAPDEWETALNRGTLDMVVAAYTITPERKERVTFAGPYYVAHQDILVRQGDESVRNVRDLRGKRLCQVSGSDSWRRVTEDRKVAASPVPARTYGECVKALADGRVDAVSTDDLTLAGLAAAPGSGATLVDAPFTDERYGIGLRKGDVDGCQAVNRILTGMYQNGAADTLLDQWFTAPGFDAASAVPRFEGCR
ncbi:glutamate ABC transporter substrate-binding protein [Actinomadura madurae]|uniref:glutamate ABC transporter substrate-binding protein n=1 Tax=Actinomadura madurae TaxID=1993 RepID=UPI000D81A347|nr:glutamate ABC transporter substrate-binding protein [Actinomadura madurae]SPT59420.1 Sulfate starvation-induced protein 7 [Actinomadura madurae]